MFRLGCNCLFLALLSATLGGIDAKAADQLSELISVVKGMEQRDAGNYVKGRGWRVAKVTWGDKNDAPPGRVVSANFVREPGNGTETPLVELIVSPRIATVPIKGANGNVLQRIVHRPFDVELDAEIRRVPLFVIRHKGMHHPPAATGQGDADLLEVRAKCIADRLSTAWRLMDEGWDLEIAPDRSYDMPEGLDIWRVDNNEPFSPTYPTNNYAANNSPVAFPAIYVKNDDDGSRLRIMTIYKEDADSVGQPFDKQGKTLSPLDPQEVAEYFVALIKAHHLLFSTRSNDIGDYNRLAICRTREGKIFREIYVRADEIAKLNGSSEISSDDLKNALAQMPMDQRDRLVALADHAPKDWRVATQ